jgi:hypothetical protein
LEYFKVYPVCAILFFMKSSIKSILVYTLISYFVLGLFNESIKLPESITYLILTLLLISFTVMIVCPVLSFLTVKCRFIPFFLMTTILLVGILYVLKMFMIDFYIEVFDFVGMDIGTMQINSFEVLPIFTMISASLAISLLCAVYRGLDSSGN